LRDMKHSLVRISARRRAFRAPRPTFFIRHFTRPQMRYARRRLLRAQARRCRSFPAAERRRFCARRDVWRSRRAGRCGGRTTTAPVRAMARLRQLLDIRENESRPCAQASSTICRAVYAAPFTTPPKMNCPVRRERNGAVRLIMRVRVCAEAQQMRAEKMRRKSGARAAARGESGATAGEAYVHADAIACCCHVETRIRSDARMRSESAMKVAATPTVSRVRCRCHTAARRHDTVHDPRQETTILPPCSTLFRHAVARDSAPSRDAQRAPQRRVVSVAIFLSPPPDRSLYATRRGGKHRVQRCAA